jgi:hypothetical protein
MGGGSKDTWVIDPGRPADAPEEASRRLDLALPEVVAGPQVDLSAMTRQSGPEQ